MKLAKLLLILTLLVSTQCKAQSDDQLRVKLQKDESLHPNTYLKTENTKCQAALDHKADLFNPAKYSNTRYNITGLIKNYASIANFKDVVLTVYFYSQTNTLLGSQSVTIYQYVQANGTASFQFEAESSPDMKRYNVIVSSATPIY